MKNIVLVLAMVGLLAGCGIVGKTFPMPSTMKCLQAAEKGVDATARQNARNECMWAKAAGKKD